MSAVRASADPDLVLVETMLAPPPLEDCRRSLEYWEQRRRTLAFYKRSARREAAEMAARWDARLRLAERARFEATLAGRILSALGLSALWEWRTRLTKRNALAFGWAIVPPKLKLAAGAVVAAWLLVATGVMAAFAALLAHLA